MKREREAAWIDEEDAVVDENMSSVKVYGRQKQTGSHSMGLRTRFQSVYGTQKWAEPNQEASDESDASEFEEFLASTSITQAISKFRRNDVQLRRRQDLNIDARGSCGPVVSMSWQPLGSESIDAEPLLAFSTKRDKEVRVCRVQENGKSSKVEYALKVSKWLKPGVVKFISPEELVVTNDIRASSRVLIYNVETGTSNFCTNVGGMEISQVQCIESNETGFTVAFDGGHIVTIDKRSKEVVSDFRLNNACVGLGWAKDGHTLLAGDERANMYTFDSRSNRCSMRTQLDILSAMSSFALNGESLAACGSPFGTVDVVDTTSWSPVVSFDKLVTGVDSLAFHPIQKSMLIAGSCDKRNAVRVYECSTGRTLPGWPSENEPIGRAVDIKFTECGRFFAIGCNSGRVQLYAL